MEVFRGGCNFISSSGVRTKGRSSTGGGGRLLNAIVHSANFYDYLCIYKLIISFCEVYNDGNCLPPKAGQNTALSVDLVP